MKRTILALLMVALAATPCFAQEIETDGIFSIFGTQWSCIGVSISCSLGCRPSFFDETVWFTDRTIETSSGTIGILQYVDTYRDFLVLSVAWDGDRWLPDCNVGNAYYVEAAIYVMQPTVGIGTFLKRSIRCRYGRTIATGIMVKQLP